MTTTIDSERIELLLALVFNRGEKDSGGDGEIEGAFVENASAPAPTRGFSQQEFLAELPIEDRAAAERSFERYAKLESEERELWLLRQLNRARQRDKLAHLDEHIHPSHIIEALRAESQRVQALVLSHLPHALAASCAEALANASGREFLTTPHSGQTPALEIVDIVRRKFLSHFVMLGEIRQPTALDLLTGVELARLVRLLGVRETAIACRGITQMETMTAFLRRFAAEDARAITAQIPLLTDVTSPRVRHAEEIVYDALELEAEPGAMLNRAGSRLLAMTLSGYEDARLRYSAQKLPVEVSGALYETVALQRKSADTSEMRRQIAAETEALAASLRRPSENERAPL